MTIEQTVDIPASRRLVIDVPREIPSGRTILAFTPVAGAEQSAGGLPCSAADIRRRYFTMSKEEQAAEDARETELFKFHAEELNQEAEDVLKDQIDPFEMIPPHDEEL